MAAVAELGSLGSVASSVLEGHMIRVAILRTFKDYPSAREEEFSGHPVAEWVRHELPCAFQEEMAEFPGITWVSSPGQGRWADAPWVAVFDPLVTETAQEGWYPV